MNHLFWALIHIVGVFGFQYTSIIWFLLLPVFHISLSMFIFIFGVAVALTPDFITENPEKRKREEFGNRFLMHSSTLVTALQLFNIGYPFFAGMAVLHGVVLSIAVALQRLYYKEE